MKKEKNERKKEKRKKKRVLKKTKIQETRSTPHPPQTKKYGYRVRNFCANALLLPPTMSPQNADGPQRVSAGQKVSLTPARAGVRSRCPRERKSSCHCNIRSDFSNTDRNPFLVGLPLTLRDILGSSNASVMTKVR